MLIIYFNISYVAEIPMLEFFTNSCATNLLQWNYLVESIPVYTTSFTSGYGAHASHITHTAPYWCSGETHTGTEYIEFVFRRTVLISEITVYGGFVEEADVPTTTAVFTTSSGDIAMSSGSTDNVDTVDTASSIDGMTYATETGWYNSTITEWDTTIFTAAQEDTSTVSTTYHIGTTAETSDVTSNLDETTSTEITTTDVSVATTLANVISGDVTFTIRYTGKPSYTKPDPTKTFDTYAENLQVCILNNIVNVFVIMHQSM